MHLYFMYTSFKWPEGNIMQILVHLYSESNPQGSYGNFHFIMSTLEKFWILKLFRFWIEMLLLNLSTAL